MHFLWGKARLCCFSRVSILGRSLGKGGEFAGTGFGCGRVFFFQPFVCISWDESAGQRSERIWRCFFFSKINFLVNMSVPPRFWVVAFVMWDLLE